MRHKNEMCSLTQVENIMLKLYWLIEYDKTFRGIVKYFCEWIEDSVLTIFVKEIINN